MDKRKNDNRSYEEIKAGWEKDGLVFGRLMSEDEKRQSGKYINERNEKIKKKERRKADKEFDRSFKDKPHFLVSCAGILEKLLHIVVTLYSMAIVINALFIWQIYKTISATGWQGIFQTKHTLYILLYFVILFVLKKVYYALYKYAHD